MGRCGRIIAIDNVCRQDGEKKRLVGREWNDGFCRGSVCLGSDGFGWKGTDEWDLEMVDYEFC